MHCQRKPGGTVQLLHAHRLAADKKWTAQYRHSLGSDIRPAGDSVANCGMWCIAPRRACMHPQSSSENVRCVIKFPPQPCSCHRVRTHERARSRGLRQQGRGPLRDGRRGPGFIAGSGARSPTPPPCVPLRCVRDALGGTWHHVSIIHTQNPASFPFRG